MGHRGADPRDATDFREAIIPRLRVAAADLGWLLGRGYASTAALKLVGDRFQLTSRQRSVILRAACEPQAPRLSRRMADDASLTGRHVTVDGFNVLVTVEKLLAGGPVFVGMDGAWRDAASIHGTWRSTAVTESALQALRDVLVGARVHWLLDRPVSNSARLAGRLRALEPTWHVEVLDKVDPQVAAAPDVAASSDGPLLDVCRAWVSLEARVATRHAGWVVDLGAEGAVSPP